MNNSTRRKLKFGADYGKSDCPGAGVRAPVLASDGTWVRQVTSGRQMRRAAKARERRNVRILLRAVAGVPLGLLAARFRVTGQHVHDLARKAGLLK